MPSMALIDQSHKKTIFSYAILRKNWNNLEQKWKKKEINLVNCKEILTEWNKIMSKVVNK